MHDDSVDNADVHANAKAGMDADADADAMDVDTDRRLLDRGQLDLNGVTRLLDGMAGKSMSSSAANVNLNANSNANYQNNRRVGFAGLNT